MTAKEIRELSYGKLREMIRGANLSSTKIYSRMGQRQASRFIERLEREEQRRRIHNLSMMYPDLEISPRE